jgi:hypothetical protein
MSLKGNFETFNLNSIFQLLSDDQKTGVLTAKNEQREIRIYIKDGEIIYATGSQKQDRLGYFLQNKDIISAEQLHATLQQSKTENKALGKILIEQGAITSQKLQQVIHQQIEHLIFNLFLWDSGEFDYTDAALNLKGMVVAKINVVSLLLEAARRIDEISIFKKHIPNNNLIFRITGKVSNKDEITLNSAELQVLGLVDGQRTVGRVIREGGFDEYSAYKILYSLLSSGLIEAVKKKPGEKKKEKKDYSTIIAFYNDILQVLYRNLESELGKQTFAIFDESKQVAASQPHALFRNFQPQNPIATNIHEISQALAPGAEYEDDRRLLIASFNEFILNILSRAIPILGPKMTQQMIQEINATLPRVNADRTQGNDKESIIEEIKHVLSQAHELMKKRRNKHRGGATAVSNKYARAPLFACNSCPAVC